MSLAKISICGEHQPQTPAPSQSRSGFSLFMAVKSFVLIQGLWGQPRAQRREMQASRWTGSFSIFVLAPHLDPQRGTSHI